MARMVEMVENTPGARAPSLWVAPLVSTVATLALAAVSFFFVALSPMACDSCHGAELARFEAGFDVGFAVVRYGLLVPSALLVTGWSLAVRGRESPWRRPVCVLAPLSVVLLHMTFLGLVDWP